jgi:hypothetical protein
MYCLWAICTGNFEVHIEIGEDLEAHPMTVFDRASEMLAVFYSFDIF